MKRILLSLVAFIITSVCFAQDIIVRKNGSTIQAKVTRVTQTEIEYKKYSNQNGPTYTIDKTDIFSINYENGTKDVFGNNTAEQSYQNTKTEPVPFAVDNNEIIQGINAGNRLQREKLLASAKSWNTVGSVIYWCSFIGGCGVAVLLICAGADDTPCYIAAGSGLGVGLLGKVVCSSIANNKEEAANSIYAAHLLKHDFKIGKNSHLTAGVDFLNDKRFKDKTLGLGVSYSF